MEAVGLIWFAAAVGVGFFWKSKGRGLVSGIVWSVILSPVVGFIIGLVLKPDLKAKEKEALQGGQMKKCPSCAEVIKAEAVTCRYCGKEVGPAPAGA